VVPDQAEIFLHLPRRVGEVIGKAGRKTVRIAYLGTIWRRPVPEERQHPRLEVGNWNILSGEIRQKTLAGLQAGNDGLAGHPQALAKSFIVAEDKHFIFDDGTAERTAELIPLEWGGIRLSVSIGILGIEEIPRIQCAVAQVLECGPMPLVRSRCG